MKDRNNAYYFSTKCVNVYKEDILIFFLRNRKENIWNHLHEYIGKAYVHVYVSQRKYCKQ